MSKSEQDLRQKQLAHISNQHPCFGKGPGMNRGRVHLPVDRLGRREIPRR